MGYIDANLTIDKIVLLLCLQNCVAVAIRYVVGRRMGESHGAWRGLRESSGPPPLFQTPHVSIEYCIGV